MSLFEPQFDDRIRRETAGDETFFSVLDVFQHYGNKANPTQSWKATLKALEKQGFDRSTQIVDRAPANGGRSTPYATFKTFLRIAQTADLREWEHLRTWMADTANERIEEVLNPELGISRANKRYIAAKQSQGLSEADAVTALRDRLDAIDGFKLLMATVNEHVIDTPKYAELVNAEYMSIFGKIAAELKMILNTKSIRDALPPMMLAYVRTSEITCQEIVKHKDRMTMGQVVQAMREVAIPLGQQLRKTCELLGISHITGQPIAPQRSGATPPNGGGE